LNLEPLNLEPTRVKEPRSVRYHPIVVIRTIRGWRPAWLLFLAGLVSAGVAVSVSAQLRRPGSPFTVLSREGRRPLPTTVAGGQEMVALSDLAALFQLTIFEDAVARGIVVSYQGRSIVLTPGQALASADGRLISLPAPVVREGRAVLVPPEFINRALASIYDARLELRKDSGLVIVGDLRVPRVAIAVEPGAAQTRLIIDVAPRAGYSIVQEQTRLLVRFEADLLDARFPALEPGPLVESLRLTEPPTSVLVALTPRVATYRAAEAPAAADSIRLTIDVLAQATETQIEPPAPPPPGTPLEPPPLLDPTPAVPIRTMVIDPGHGGDETGARGPSGILEKDVTLAVARRLKATIEARLGIRVLLTRDRDATVRLDERAALANNNKADLFLSLHANASVNPAVKGAEVFSLSLEEYGEAAQRAAQPDPGALLPVFGGGTRPIEVIPWELAQARHVDASSELARLIEEQLRASIEMSPRALQSAPFRVLVGANMPAVLVEMGFITNAEQERQLNGDAMQGSLVQSLYTSIVRFRDYLEMRRAAPRPVAAAPTTGTKEDRR
jgi:N-acetylmuramoyl-L-alanine amidase